MKRKKQSPQKLLARIEAAERRLTALEKIFAVPTQTSDATVAVTPLPQGAVVHFCNPSAEPCVTACGVPQKDALNKSGNLSLVTCARCYWEIREEPLPPPAERTTGSI